MLCDSLFRAALAELNGIIPENDGSVLMKFRWSALYLAGSLTFALAGQAVWAQDAPLAPPPAQPAPGVPVIQPAPGTTPPPAAPQTKPAAPGAPADQQAPDAATPPAPPLAPQDKPPAPEPDAATKAAEAQVLVAEVRVVNNAAGGKELPELEQEVYKVIKTRAGETTTRTQLQEDINAVFSTGYFSTVKATPEDTPLGVRVTFDVAPNPALTEVVADGRTVLPEAEFNQFFAEQKGKTINYGRLQQSIKDVEEWYAQKGYVLAKVTDVQSSPDGKVTLTLTEGNVEDVVVKNNTRTRDFIVTREMDLKPGQVFNRDKVQKDLQKLFALNLFEDVSLELNPGKDPKKVVVGVKVKEKNTGSLAAGAGVDSARGVFGTLSLQEQNLGGNNQKAGLDLQLGTQQIQANLNYTDPWLNSDPSRTALNVNLFNRDTFSYIFDEGVRLSNGDTPRENRLGVRAALARPLTEYGSSWRGSAGLSLERVQLRDSTGGPQTVDQNGNPLTLSGSSIDNLFTLETSIANDLRDNPTNPKQGSFFSLGADQALPVFSNGGTAPSFTRLAATYSQFVPVNLLPFGSGKQVLAFNGRLGTLLGEFPPYEAYTLGGSNSVRGFFEGGLGTGRSFFIGTTELRFPVFDPVGGVAFVDYGSDLGSAAAVLGAPAIVRGKPGNALGYGLGLRIQSPLGPLRIDFGFNSVNKPSQVHFGLGEKF
jgi:outer membrane protein insertion porin family